MALSKLTNAVIAASNENTLGLANFNFDFSLVKLDAPKEFAPLGSALTVQRRTVAEDGPVHQTVRKLGALFEQLLPSTPRLIQAYGIRVTKIIQSPGVNPKGSTADGPFESYVGADGTSIWAAATSGPASISVLLLAFILARKFEDAKISTAIWAQLVHERQEEIKQSLEDGHIVSASSAMAARQTLSRNDLAIFDASARAWLSSADSAKRLQQDQLMLILRNIPSWVSTGPSTYSKVITAWKAAMQGMEDILNCKPQQISDGAILLAISAWHLYPDLIVLHSKPTKVSFKDPLVPSEAIITIGLDSTNAEMNRGIRWSLTLSHLRHYGDPVKVDNSESNTRITVEQLVIVGFGAFMSTWGFRPKYFPEAASLVIAIWNCLLKGRTPEKELRKTFMYLFWAAKSARSVLSSLKSHPDKTTMLLGFGSRRSAKFFSAQNTDTLPASGLCSDLILQSLSTYSSIECGIRYFRRLTALLGLPGSDAIIVYIDTEASDDSANHLVFATAAELPSTKPKRLPDGVEKNTSRHIRWIHEVSDGKPKKCSTECYGEFKRKFASSRMEEELFTLQGELPKTSEEHIDWGDPPLEYTSAHQNTRPNGSTQTKIRVSFTKLIGYHHLMALFVKCRDKTQIKRLKGYCSSFQKLNVSLHSAQEAFKSAVHPDTLKIYLTILQNPVSVSNCQAHIFMMSPSEEIQPSTLSSLKALLIASAVYDQFPSATVPLKITSASIAHAKWLPSDSSIYSGNILQSISRSEAFACIAMFESGVNIEPNQLGRVIAISAENSIFVTSLLLSDPMERLPPASMKRVAGNIGEPGVCLLVVPEEPRVRPINDDYSLVMHADYDGNRVDKFQGTSLHLSFTGWKVPIVWGADDYIDQDVHFLGAIVSVRDQGSWVADIDILKTLPHTINSGLAAHATSLCCTCPRPAGSLEGDFVSIDNWNEVLDIPQNAAIVRSHTNWWARLAISSILRRLHPQRHAILVNQQVECWKCFGSDQAWLSEWLRVILID
ncbi:MAG: hypothetical protein Q9227_007725 [Pyrenula ochraceoflavens]